MIIELMKMMRIAPVITLLLVLLAGWFLYQNRDSLLKKSSECLVNQATKEIFTGSLRIGEVKLHSGFQIELQDIRGQITAKSGAVNLFLNQIWSQDSLLNLLLKKPVRFSFSGLDFLPNSEKGIQGEIILTPGKEPVFEIRGTVDGLDLHHLIWLDPVNLTGSTGILKGNYLIKTRGEALLDCGLDLKIQEPGGRIQSKFFDILRSYLPQLKSQEALNQISLLQGIVPYQNAAFQAQIDGPNQMKVLLHILVQDYNLDLRLNLAIRIDQKNAFLQLAQIAGLVQIST